MKKRKQREKKYSLGYRIIKMQLYIIIISITLFIATNLGWLYYFIKLNETNLQYKPQNSVLFINGNNNISKMFAIISQNKKRKIIKKVLINV